MRFPSRLSLERPAAPIVFLGLYLVAYSAAVLFVPGREPPLPLVFDTAYMPFRIATVVMLWMASRRTADPAIARAWMLLAAAQVFAVGSNSTWIVSDVTGEETASITYLAWTIPENVLRMSGYWMMVRPRDGRFALSADWVDSVILVVSCASIAWYFIAAGLVTTAYDDQTGVILLFFDSASNAATLLLAAVAWIRAPRGLSPGAMPRTVAGLLMLAASDLVLDRQMALDTYRPGSLIDIWFGAAILCIALGAHAQYHDRGISPPTPRTPDRSDAVVFGALIASLLPLGVELGSRGLFSNAFAASGLGVGILMLLVLWRQRLARREIELMIADRLSLERQLVQAQKMETVGRLTSGIAHDFNNILASISAHAQLIGSTTSAETRADTDAIEFAVTRAAALTRRLLAFGSTATVEPAPVQIGGVIQSLEPLVRRLLPSDVSLTVHQPDDEITVVLADGQLEQIVLNLVINARDAMPFGGQLTVTISQLPAYPSWAPGPPDGSGQSWAEVSVADTGTGMDQATQDRLFEPFFTTKPKEQGTGLGLATVSAIVTANGGRIIVDSERGRGTRMRVLLPIATSVELIAAVADLPTSSPGVITLLVVDDEEAIRSAISRFFTKLGFRVFQAEDGVAALDPSLLGDVTPDLLITDVRMPRLSGIELAQQLRRRWPRLPAVFVTGFANPDLGPLTAEGSGAVIVLRKPFDLGDLATRARQLVEESRASVARETGR